MMTEDDMKRVEGVAAQSPHDREDRIAEAKRWRTDDVVFGFGVGFLAFMAVVGVLFLHGIL